MGMQDRDYYKDWWRKRTGYIEPARFRKEENDVKGVMYDPKLFRSGDRGGGDSALPVVSGVGRHLLWRILFCIVIFGAFFAVFKGIERQRLLTRVIEEQYQQIQSQSKRIQELENLLNRQKSKVDFFR